MSISIQKSFLQQLVELHSYLRLLGEHINHIYTRLEEIERKIKALNDEQIASIETVKIELEYVKGIIVAKSEVNEVLRELNKGIQGSFPLLPTLEQPIKEPEPIETPLTMEEPKKEEKKRRFPFLRRF